MSYFCRKIADLIDPRFPFLQRPSFCSQTPIGLTGLRFVPQATALALPYSIISCWWIFKSDFSCS